MGGVPTPNGHPRYRFIPELPERLKGAEMERPPTAPPDSAREALDMRIKLDRINLSEVSMPRSSSDKN